MKATRVQVVEDEAFVIEDLLDRLARFGYTVVATADTGETAVEKALETRPDLILMDIRLHGQMDGVQAATQIRASLDVPIIYLTAHADDETLARVKATEPEGYVLKPFRDRELKAVIEMALHKYALAQKLRKTERLLATTLHSLGEAIITTDVEGNVTFMNPVAETFTGWGEAEALGRPVVEIAPLVGMAKYPVSLVLEGEMPLPALEPLQLRDRAGQTRPVSPTTSPILDDSGAVSGCVLVCRDESERIQAEANLRRSEERFRTSVENMLDGFGLLSPIRDEIGQIIDFRYEYINETGCRTNGRSCQDHYTHTLLELLPPFREIGLVAAYAAVVETGQPFSQEILRRGENDEGGQQLIQAYDVQAVKLGDGLAVTWRDILARKRAEEQVRYQANLLENVSDAVIATDLNLVVRSWNRAAEMIYDWTTEEAIGQPMPLLLAPVHPHGEQVEEIMAIVMEHGRWQGEVQVHRKDGAQRYVQISISLIYDATGRPVGTVGVNRDITEQRRIEAALHKTEERLHLALQNSPIVLFSQDQELRYTWIFNPVAELAASAVVGKTDAELLSPNEAAVLTDLKRRVLVTGRSERREVKVSPGQEASLYYDLFVEPLHDAVGAVVGVNCVATDITRLKQTETALREANETLEARVQERTAELIETNESLLAEVLERQRIEQELRQSEEVLRQLTENIRETFFIYEIESGRLLYISQSAEHLWGLSLERLRQNFRVFLETTHPEDRERISNSLKQLPHKSNRVFDEEFRMLSPRGDIRWAWVRTFPIRNQAGEIYRIAGLIEDTTERKQAEVKLTESEARYRSLFNGMSEGFALHEIVFDEQNQPSDYRFLDINPAFERQTGLSRQNVVGRLKSEVVPDDDPYWLEIYGQVALDGEAVHFDHYASTLQRHYEVFAYCPAPRQFAVLFLDITERKQAEKQLRASEEKYRQLVELAQEGIWTIDTKAKTAFVNPRMAEMLGYSEAEMLGRLLFDFMEEQDVKLARENIERRMRGIREQHDFEFRRKDGTRLYASLETTPLTDEQGQYNGALVMVSDITTRRLAEEALRTSEKNLWAILSATTDSIFLMDVEGTVLTMNEASARRLKTTVEEITGQNVYEFIPADVGKSRKKKVDEVLRTGRPVNFIDHRWGVWMDQTIYPILDVNGQKVVRLAIFAQDITARKRAEEDLLRQLKHTALLNDIVRATMARVDLDSVFRTALEQLETHLPVDFSIIALQSSSNEALTVATYGQKSHKRCAQLDLSSGQGFPLREMNPENWLNWQQTLHYYPELTQFDHPMARRISQTGLHAIVVLPLLTPNNGPLGLLTLGREPANSFVPRELEFLAQVSEHVSLAIQHIHLYQKLHTAYEDLRQSQENILKVERLRALGQMASGIAHDINNALVPILGFADVLMLRNPNLGEDARKYLEHIKLAGEDISRIVHRMREFYRPRSEQEPLAAVDLNQIMSQVIEMTRPQWRDIPQEQAIPITVETDLAAGLPQIQGIESELRQALTNLIINAVQAMPQGGTLTLRTRQLTGWIAAEVIDTGTGMDEKTRRRCLEPFFTTKGQQGSGLGLSMVYGMIQRHNGSIEIDSALGQGTTIRLLFPVHIETSPDRVGVAISEPIVPALRILCVDDDPRVRNLLDELLTYEGHQPTLTDGGEAAIKLFQQALAQGRPFDVVMTDLGMPYVGGREVARAVKQSAPQTPVILLSGWGRQMLDQYDLPSGVDVVLSKPVTISVIRGALAQARRQDLPPTD